MSDLVTVTPAHFLGQCPDLTVLELPFAIDGHQKVMAWHAKSHYDPVQMWFRHVMKDVAGKLGDFRQPKKKNTAYPTINGV